MVADIRWETDADCSPSDVDCRQSEECGDLNTVCVQLCDSNINTWRLHMASVPSRCMDVLTNPMGAGVARGNIKCSRHLVHRMRSKRLENAIMFFKSSRTLTPARPFGNSFATRAMLPFNAWAATEVRPDMSTMLSTDAMRLDVLLLSRPALSASTCSPWLSSVGSIQRQEPPLLLVVTLSRSC